MSCQCKVKVVKEKTKKNLKLLKDEICSKIMLTADSCEQTVYQTVKVKPSGTIKVYNASDFIMEILIKRAKKHKEDFICILPRTEKVITSSSIDRIIAKCSWLDGHEICSGCLTLIVNYPFDHPEYSDRCYCEYKEETKEKIDDVIW